MKKGLRRLVTATSLLIAMTGQVQASETLDDIANTGELKVCFDAGYLPFAIKGKSGNFMGFDIDFSRLMAKHMGVKFVPVNTAWDGIIPALLTDKCHMVISGMTINAQRNMRVNFSDPYIVVGQSLLINPKLKGKVTSYKDLNDGQYKVVSKLGTSGEMAIKKHLRKVNYHAFEAETDAALEVVNGRADAMVYDLPFVSIYALQNKGDIEAILEPFTFEPLGIAVRPNDPDILNLVNNFISQIKGDGSYERIYNKWFKSREWLKQLK